MSGTESSSSPRVGIWPAKKEASVAAAERAADMLRTAIADRGSARILLATGNSQIDLVDHLVTLPGIDWSKVEGLHLDEYAGIAAGHPASFRRWIEERFTSQVHPGTMHYIEGDAPDLETVLREYAVQLLAGPIDIAFVGIGENGHIAFNDPPVADFADPLQIKRVTLDERCRLQQVNEGHFPDLAAVPTEALSVTCSGLFRARHWICCVPEARKAEAAKSSLQGPVSTSCPGSLVQRHPSAFVYLDSDSARELDPSFVEARCDVH